MNARTDQTREYRIAGMTCTHCEKHVREAVETLDGVASAEADAGSGLLRVTGSGPDDTAIAAAVSDAGYEVKT